MLQSGERVLWQGRPRMLWYVVGPGEIFVLLFFAVWVIGAGAALAAPTSPNAPPPWFFLFPVVFIVIFFVGPMWIGRLFEASRTRYTLTDRRVVIDGWRRRAELDLRTLQFLELQRPLAGPSSIYFAPRGPYEGWSTGWWGGRWTPSFRAIDGADDVYRLLSDARVRARQ